MPLRLASTEGVACPLKCLSAQAFSPAPRQAETSGLGPLSTRWLDSSTAWSRTLREISPGLLLRQERTSNIIQFTEAVTRVTGVTWLFSISDPASGRSGTSSSLDASRSESRSSLGKVFFRQAASPPAHMSRVECHGKTEISLASKSKFPTMASSLSSKLAVPRSFSVSRDGLARPVSGLVRPAPV